MERATMNNKDNLFKLLSFLETKEEIPSYDVNEVLKKAGFNSEEIGKKFQAVANQSMAKSDLNWRNTAQIAHEQARADYLRKKSIERPHRSRSEIIEIITLLLTQQNLNLAIAHRNFTNQTDEDLESLLDQLEFIASSKSNDTNE
jgi:hypothetical protein